MPVSLQEISERVEMQEVLTRSYYAVDDHNWPPYRSLFTPDAISALLIAIDGDTTTR